ncbi:hypothetical protein [Pseudofulvibacter geojedonensis]|uniref:SdiA-regulated family protein n=1 Tax=Pseudofulvibacter geojedonensis TaxID=1123758 RepID=A0ABW3I4I1_9FLAO
MKLTYFSIFFFFLSILSCGSKKSDTIKVIADLPKSLKESSGIENLNGADNFWMINDSGNDNELFEVTPKGKIKRVVEVVNTRNKDWEDLASNGSDQLFIGDFGNNNNKRKDLAIYWVNINQIQNNKVIAIKTSFYFQDQEKFPPKKKDRNFDVEAFVYKEGYFYLFTKNRSSKFDGTTKLYKLLAQEGKQKAILIDTFVTCQDQSDCLITSAVLSKDKNELVLLTHNKLFKFSDFKGGNFFDGVIKEISLHHKSQKEAICFKNGELFITDEATKTEGGKLYKVLN